MAQAFAARASSIGASLCLLSAMVVVALTSTYRITLPPPNVSPPSITMAMPEPPQPTPTPPKPAQPAAPSERLSVAPIAIVQTLTAPHATGGLARAPVPTEITRPTWARVPRDLDRFYPRGAMRQSVEGRAVLDCLVATTGALACTLASETPAGWGFGAAALQIAAEYRMQPAMRDGAPVEGQYRMAVPFHLR